MYDLYIHIFDIITLLYQPTRLKGTRVFNILIIPRGERVQKRVAKRVANWKPL